MFFTQKKTADKTGINIENKQKLNIIEKNDAIKIEKRMEIKDDNSLNRINNNFTSSEKRKNETSYEEIATIKSNKPVAKAKPKATPEIPKSQGLISNFFNKK